MHEMLTWKSKTDEKNPKNGRITNENPQNLRDTNAKNQMEDILDNEGGTNITRRNRIL